MDVGWIKIHRNILNNWISENDAYFSAWIKIVLNVNFKKNKTLVKGVLIDCERGQSIKSLDTWSKIFGSSWTKNKVRTFFKILESDGMINTENVVVTTRLTVCNYIAYQDESHNECLNNHTHSTRTPHALHTHSTQNKERKECKKEENDKEEEVYFNSFWDSYHSITGISKTDKESTLKHWKKLTLDEKKKSIDKISEYNQSVSDKKFIKKARTYLSDKNFNDEFKIEMTYAERILSFGLRDFDKSKEVFNG